MAPVYDLARSRYASTLVAACFAASLLVLAVMVASTSASLGGQLRPATSPLEGRTLVGPEELPDQFRILESGFSGAPSGAIAPTSAPEVTVPPPAGAADGAGAPATPATPPATPAPSVPGVGEVTVPTVPPLPGVPEIGDVVDELRSLVEGLPAGATFGGLVP